MKNRESTFPHFVIRLGHGRWDASLGWYCCLPWHRVALQARVIPWPLGPPMTEKHTTCCVKTKKSLLMLVPPFCIQEWCYFCLTVFNRRMGLAMSHWWLVVNGIITRLSVNITHKQVNKDQSYIKANKLNSAGAKISHILISPLGILSNILIQPFICQYEDNPKRTIRQPGFIVLNDLWHMLSHLVGYRRDRKGAPFDNHNQTCLLH